MIHTSVIIPTLHSPWLPQIAKALHNQNYDLAGTEVLIIGLDDGAAALENGLIQYVPTAQPTPPAHSRNIGIRRAQGDLLCFLDSDCIPEPTWLASLTLPYQDSEVGVVGGTIAVPEDYWTLCDTIAHFNHVMVEAQHDAAVMSGRVKVNHLPTLNFSARAAVFESVGLFDEAFLRPSGEDTELTKRMVSGGYPLHLATDAVIFHAATRKGIADVLQRSYYHGQAGLVPSYRQQLMNESRLFNRWLLVLTAPLRALAVTAQIYGRFPRLRRFWTTIPTVYLIKLTWILSLAWALHRSTRHGFQINANGGREDHE